MLTDYLHIVSDQCHAGANRIDMRATWFGLDSLVRTDLFTLPSGTQVRGEWVAEGGDQTLAAEIREPRILCKKGKLSLTFTGTNISIRLGLNPGWGTGAVHLDGVAPSSMGLPVASDSINCDADAHGSWGNEYRDFVLADGLAEGEHTLEIYCNNTAAGAGGFVVVTGCKVYSQANTIRTRDVWVVPHAELAQAETLSITNLASATVNEVSATFSAGLVDGDGLPLGTKSWTQLGANESGDVVVVPLLSGAETSGEQIETCTLTSLYPDTNGSIVRSALTNVLPTSVDIVTVGAWTQDSDFGELRSYASALGANVAMTINAPSFTLRVQKEYGWGTFNIFKDTDNVTGCAWTSGSNVVTFPAASAEKFVVGRYVYGTGLNTATITAVTSGTTCTVSKNATSTKTNQTLAVDTLLTTVSCHDAEGGGFFAEVVINGLTNATGNKVKIANGTSGKFVTWSKISWSVDTLFSQRSEVLQLKFNRRHIPPFPLTNTQLQSGRPVWDAAPVNQVDLVSPYDNRGLVEERAEARFPTFVVIYKPGFIETIKEYDIAIVDPFGITRKEVAELQALGIKVITYVSFGEEDSTLADIWDETSAQVPWIGDGLGPGGYASYYCKGGYSFGEMSECVHDRQRLEGMVACAQGNANYNTSLGRCTAACQRDWREGYASWQDGGACGGGYTSSSFWQRDATKACTNTGCPKYLPPNNKCAQYEQADVWGQDFSLATPDFPDENGIWASYYVDPVPTGAGSWYARIRDYYLPLIFNLPTPRDETLPVENRTIAGNTILGIVVNHAPLDTDEPLVVSDVATGYVYTKGLDWDVDDKLGIFKFHPTETAPAIVAGQQIRTQYSSKGLGSDGVFMDTVDTVDIYPAEVYQAAAAKLINDMKALYPDRLFCSNRGFSILDRIIQSCGYVMFETFLSEYDWDAKTYYKITNPDTVAWNDTITDQLVALRRKHVFDVLGLNYCSNGPEGDELRAYIREETLKRGWLSWSSEILLDQPLSNTGYMLGKGPIRTNLWRVMRVKRPG